MRWRVICHEAQISLCVAELDGESDSGSESSILAIFSIATVARLYTKIWRLPAFTNRCANPSATGFASRIAFDPASRRIKVKRCYSLIHARWPEALEETLPVANSFRHWMGTGSGKKQLWESRCRADGKNAVARLPVQWLGVRKSVFTIGNVSGIWFNPLKKPGYHV